MPPRQLRPALPADLELICLRCLEKAPEDRFASAHDLAAALDSFLKGEDVDVRPPGAVARLKRWARREPALASRLVMLLACMTIAQGYYQFLGDTPLSLHLEVQGLLAAWAASAFLCQRLLGVPRRADVARYLWAALDVGLFSLLVLRADYVDTPAVVGYPLLIAAAGLWFRPGLVWFTAGAGAASYALLLALATARHGEVKAINLHVVFLLSLVLLALVTAYQVQRVRALSKYYEHRPLP